MKSVASREHRAALVFRDIDITRMEGVRERFRIDDLSSGINLVHGPNGIGKSRTAVALQSLIWPGTSSNRAEIYGTMRVSNETWRVELDTGSVRYQRNGVPGSTPEMNRLSDSHRDRYLLTLQDLLRVDNREFAREIQREAAGGYDLAQVREELEVRVPRPSRLSRELRDAETTVAELRREDQDLRRQELSLADSRAELDAAIAAGERGRLLEAALDYSRAREHLQAAQVARDAFADPLGRMTGEEYQQVQELQSQLRQQELRRSEIEYQLEHNARDLEQTGFARWPAPGTLITTLRGRLAKMRQCEAEYQQAQRQAEVSATRVEAFRKRLGEQITEDQLAALDSDGLRTLSRLTQQFRDAEAEHYAQEILYQWLGDIDAPADLDQLRRGHDLLARYLQIEQAGQSGFSPIVRWTLLGAALLIVVQAILLTTLATPAYLLSGLLAGPVVWVALRRGESVDAQIGQIRDDYVRLGLASPGEWTRDQVSSTLVVVQQAIARAELDHQKHLRWNDLAGKRSRAEARRRGLESERQKLLAAFGVIPDDQDHESLRHIANALDEWRDAKDSLAQAQATAASVHRESDGLLASINDELRKYNAPIATDPSSVHAAIEALAERIANVERLQSAAQHEQRLVSSEIQPHIERLDEQISEIYSSLGIDAGDEHRLRELCDRVEECREAQSELDKAEVVVKTELARLSDAPELAGLSREDIDRQLLDAAERAGRRDEIQERISNIEASLRQARQQTALEQAISDEADAVDALRDYRQRDYGAAAAKRVFELVQDQNQEVNRPTVFRVADDYFRLFTTGAYRLGIMDGANPDFLAIDTATGRSLTLDQLSSGTRVQLLLAVRLAFIESTEHGPQLPIILDETLGNTDDVRATAIIDATIEIAKRGRQVIYFTAQRDEIGKWHASLDGQVDGPAWSVFDLALIRGDARAGTYPGFEWDPGIFEAAEIPHDTDYERLYSLLNVPAVDLWAERADGVDLWYLIPEVEPLVTLRNRRVRTWGQYLALHRSQHLEGVWTEALHQRARARAQVIEAVCREWRRGRPVPLTKQFLHTSGHISETFRDRVDECAERHGWDGEALIRALNKGEVSRFYQSNIDGLEEWFREHGRIIDVATVSQEMIRARALSVASGAIEEGVIDEREVDALLMSMSGELASESYA